MNLKWMKAGLALVMLTLAARGFGAAAPSVSLNFLVGTNASEGQGIAVSSDGSIYTTGQYGNTANFGGIVLTNGGSFDYFLAKHTAMGQIVWAVRAGTSGADFGSDVIVDRDGNVVVAGVIQGTNDFHGITNVAGFGGKDWFLAKYSPAGTLLWVRLAGSTTDDQAFDVAEDGAGNYFVSGRITGVASFGGGVSIGAAGQTRCALAKYDANGQILWARDVGETDSPSTTGVAADTNGNGYITGLSTTSNGPFVAKYDSAGTQQWLRVGTTGNAFFDEASSAAVDGAGNVYLAGRFGAATITFGSIVLNNAGNVPRGFVAKYDAAGSPQWATLTGARAFDVSVTGAGVVYVTGFSSGTATNIATAAVTNQGSLDIFAAQLDSNGNLDWLVPAGTSNNDLARAIARTSDGSVFLIGEAGNNVFGTGTFSGGVYVAKLGAPPSPTLSVSVSGQAVVVAWPPTTTGYAIETSFGLGSAFQRGVVVFNLMPGQTNAYQTSLTASNLFIRLAKP